MISAQSLGAMTSFNFSATFLPLGVSEKAYPVRVSEYPETTEKSILEDLKPKQRA